MEFLGITRLSKKGLSEECFVLRCEEHNWFYTGRPPLTTGCRECWLTYYTGELARKGGDLSIEVDKLEAVIRHAAEADSKGEFDFKPEFQMEINKDN
jgi:hypothetical protein